MSCERLEQMRRLTSKVLVLVLASAVGRLNAEELFPPELTQFRPISGNPVFEAAGDGHWDVRIRERGWVVRHGDGYRLYYTGYDGSREGLKMLGLAESQDGLTWRRVGSGPLYRDHWVEDMMVVERDGRYFMFAEGAGDQAHLLVSDDGVKWTRRGPLDVRLTNGKPIPPGPYGTPAALVHDGRWYLFYERRDAGIWLAVSDDLKVWTNVSDEPVMRPGPQEFDRLMIALNQVIEYRGKFYAVIHGSGSPEKPRLWATGLAVSDDLIHWTKYPGNPLLPIAENKSSGQLVFDGQRFRLYTLHDRVDVHLGPVAVEDEPSLESLRKSLLFHASFDESEHADFARGDAKLYTAQSLKRDQVTAGLSPEAGRLDGNGKYGRSLFYPSKTSMITFYKGGKNVAYSRGKPYATTISFWMSLTPDEDLPPGFVDPLQITDKKWNDAAIFVDFNKTTPREFRLGVYSDLAFWNPQQRDFNQIPESELPLIPVRQPPFRKDRWTHVAITLEGMNSTESTSSATLYLDGQAQGRLARAQRFTWKPEDVVIMLGIYYVGRIDDFAIFDRALSAAELKSLMKLPRGIKSIP